MNEVILLGIDGGATKISGWEINFDKKTNTFKLGQLNVQRKYSQYDSFDPSFKPVDINIQIAEINTSINLTDDEIPQGKAYMNAAIDVIQKLADNNAGKVVLVGFGMPGLKTQDKRGITALANGPRMPFFSDYIENKLIEKGVKLFSPINHLGSDADYCGIGEEYDINGSFRKVQNAYYLGGGTGVADALKLDGELVPFDNSKGWIAKTWEMKSAKDITLERYTSASGIQQIYSQNSGLSIEEINIKEIYPTQILEMAIQGDKYALDTINDISITIGKVFFERITTIYSGFAGLFDFVNPAKPKLSVNHSYEGTLLDSIIIGQRLGDLFQQSKSSDLLWKQMLNSLTDLVLNSTDQKFKDHYLKDDYFNEDILKISKLREAPAIGAGVDAYLTSKFNK